MLRCPGFSNGELNKNKGKFVENVSYKVTTLKRKQVYTGVWRQMLPQVKRQVYRQVWNQVFIQTHEQTHNQTEAGEL